MADEFDMEESKEKGSLKEEVMNGFESLAEAYKRTKSGGSLEDEGDKSVGGVVYTRADQKVKHVVKPHKSKGAKLRLKEKSAAKAASGGGNKKS